MAALGADGGNEANHRRPVVSRNPAAHLRGGTTQYEPTRYARHAQRTDTAAAAAAAATAGTDDRDGDSDDNIFFAMVLPKMVFRCAVHGGDKHVGTLRYKPQYRIMGKFQN